MKRELRHLEEYLEDGETVRELTGGLVKNRGNGLLALTDRRVVFIFRGLVNSGLEEFRLNQLTSISMTGGLMWATINLTVAGATQSIQSVDKADANRMVPAIRSALGSAQVPIGTAQAVCPVNVLEQIATLKELHETGVLTDEEFSRKKTELLARL